MVMLFKRYPEQKLECSIILLRTLIETQKDFFGVVVYCSSVWEEYLGFEQPEEKMGVCVIEKKHKRLIF